LYERKNKIKGIINNIVNKLVNYYNDKKVFIVGYNENWKNKVALNKNTNRMFYQIPYKEILDKLKDKLLSQGKKLITIEESYTSKSDSLTFEKMNSETKFNGNRKHRGLFISSIGKALNADLNGAINIMRKVFDLKQILGTNIYNPSILCYK
jgi:putative transposase